MNGNHSFEDLLKLLNHGQFVHFVDNLLEALRFISFHQQVHKSFILAVSIKLAKILIFHILQLLVHHQLPLDCLRLLQLRHNLNSDLFPHFKMVCLVHIPVFPSAKLVFARMRVLKDTLDVAGLIYHGDPRIDLIFLIQ